MNSQAEKKVIVIGSGIGGLAAAIRMAIKGYDVSVIEKNNGPGGKLTMFKLGAYRFDFGPSLFTMPEYVEELFLLAGKEPSKYFDYLKLDEACRYFYPDGSQFFAPTDAKSFAEFASDHFDVEIEKINKYFAYNQKIFEESGHIFLNNSMHKLKTFMNREAIKSTMQSYVIELFRSMNTANVKSLEHPKLVQLFNRYATYNGSSPYKAPAMLNSISVLEHLYGTYFPRGGMYSITNALYKLALDLGVTFTFNRKVDQILIAKRRAYGVTIGKEEIIADKIISNMDVTFTYESLLSKSKFKHAKGKEKSSSAVIFYWGIKKKFQQLGLHNIFFAENYNKEFDDIFKKKVLHEDPTIYINNSSFHNLEDAPKGCANWFVMINAPADFGQDWEDQLITLKNNVLSKLSQTLGEDIASLIEEERIVTPKIIESQTLSHKGALYGSSSNHWLTAFLRHPNFSRKLKGLYFVGGSVHPGGGIPLCLLSAKITTSLIDE